MAVDVMMMMMMMTHSVQSAQSVSWVVQEVQCSYDKDLDGREAGSLT